MLLSATILLLIILPLTISLALSLPSVQRHLVGWFTEVASEKIDAKVAVGAIDYAMPNDIIFRDLLVEDQAGDTLIYSKETSVRLSVLSPFHKELTLSHIGINDGQLQLREMEAGVLNIKQIVERITNPENDGAFRTSIKKIDVKGLDFSLQRLVSLKREYGVDLSDIQIKGIDGTITNFVSHQKVTELSVESFAGVEQSGLKINSLSTDLVVYEGVVDLMNFKATTENSRLNIQKLRLENDSWEGYKDFNALVSIELQSNRSWLAASDVAYFAPALKDKTFTAKSLTFALNGTVDNLEAQIESLTFGEGSQMVGDLAVRGVTQVESSNFEIEISELKTTLKDINSTLIGFGASPLQNTAQQIVGALDKITLTASAQGSMAKMALAATMRSTQGEVRYKGQLESLGKQPKIEGTVTTKELNVGNLLNNQMVGAVDLAANVYYRKNRASYTTGVDGAITKADYNNCQYFDIKLHAAFDGEQLESTIVSRNKALDFDLEALLGLGEMHHYDVTMRINKADLNAMALNRRDSISRVSGSVKVKLRGNTLDDLNGLVTLRNINYQYNEKSLYSPMIDMTARNTESSKFLSLESDYLDMTFNSKSSYEVLYAYLRDGLREYIPLLYTARTERKSGKSVTIANNYSTLSVNFKEFNQVADAIVSRLNVADNTALNLMVNPYSERFSLRVKSDYMEHNTLAAAGININASNDKDSLSLYATASNLFVGRNSLSAATLMAGARNNVLELSTGFRDSLASLSATLGMRVKFDGVHRASIALLPSQVSMEDDMWMISADQIEGEGAKLKIDNFAMVNGQQRLTLNGTISKEPSDSLVLKLNNYDIGLITSVVGDMGYSIDGLSNGYINIRQLLNSPRIVADVELDSVEVNSIPSPPLKLSARWDTEQNRARVLVSNRNNDETVVTGYYAPADTRYYARLKVDSLNMGLIDPLLKTTISGTKGYANVDVTLRGEHKNAALNGTIDVYDLSTKIIFTQVDYNIPAARIEVNDNKLRSQAREFFDSDGNRGLITLNLSLDHLSNVSYSMRIVPEDMLVLNTTERDNELFYGKLYATGVATINGDKRGVNMDITATSSSNSSFFMPLSTKSTVAKTDFITFVQNRKEPQQSASTNFRRNYIDERNRRMSAQSTAQVNINMALHATPDLDFQIVIDPVVGDIIKARGEGRLNLNIAPQSNTFEMYGDYNITEGNYLFTLLNPISKRFVIDSGSSIQWTGDPIDPILNIDAVYKVKTSLDPLTGGTSSDYSSDSSTSRAVPVDCIIHLGDRLNQPSVDFSIEVPTADTEQQAVIANTLIDQETISQQFFYLMFANSFIPVSTSYGSGLTGSTTASTGFELLTNQLSNWLSSSNYNVVIRYRPESDLTSDEVDLGFSRGLIDNRLLIEVEGNYLADNKTMDDSNFSNFMVEAYITWLIDKAGTLRLKGFTQTIDRYDENQGLQETGIGIYYSESFDTFKELKRKIADRFRRKK
ncbi:MAG: hypothetical protein R3Y44_01360 [Rikenellaceae bacterium]